MESGVQHILDAFPFSVLLIDPDHQIVAANEVTKKNLDMVEEELIGAYCPIVIHGLREPVTECPLAEALEKGEAVEKEIFDARSGHWINAAVYPTPMVTADNKPIYLHFVRDITEIKAISADLSKSLEHHRALCNILQDLQHCRNCQQIMETLLDQVISLSWLGVEAAAVGFLSNGKDLDLIAHRNVAPELIERCRHLGPGECLCGKAAQAGRPILRPSSSPDHSIKYKGMGEHQHVILPIRHKGYTLGVLTLYLRPGDKIGNFRLGFLKAAAAAAGAVLDGQLAREEVLRTQEKYIAQAINSQEDERKRVAYDLHDHLAQSLSAILLEMQSNRSKHTTDGSVQLRLEAGIRDLIDQIRKMAGQLRPPILDDYGLESALSRKIQEISGRVGIAIDYQAVSSDENKERLPDAVEVGLYRVAMEALDNAVLHAAASRISVIVLRQEEKVTLLVEDDGHGFDFRDTRRDMDHCRGLILMTERVAVLGGSLQIESAPEKGTTVRAEVPVRSIN